MHCIYDTPDEVTRRVICINMLRRQQLRSPPRVYGLRGCFIIIIREWFYSNIDLTDTEWH